MPCDFCTDPDGVPCFPQYGLAPHKSFDEKGKPIEAEFLPQDDWPEHFTPDPDNMQYGIYHCPQCGDGKPEPAESELVETIQE